MNYIWLLTSIIGAGFPESVLDGDGKDARSGPESVRRSARAVERASSTASPRRRAPTKCSRAQRARQALKDQHGGVLQSLRRHRHADHAGHRLQARSQRTVHRAQPIDVDGATSPVRAPCWAGSRSRPRCICRRSRCRRDARTSGMPVGVQIVGPLNGEDAPVRFRGAVEDGLGGFSAAVVATLCVAGEKIARASAAGGIFLQDAAPFEIVDVAARCGL